MWWALVSVYFLLTFLTSAYKCNMAACGGEFGTTLDRSFQSGVTHDIEVCLGTDCWAESVEFEDGHGVGANTMCIGADNTIHVGLGHDRLSFRRRGK